MHLHLAHLCWSTDSCAGQDDAFDLALADSKLGLGLPGLRKQLEAESTRLQLTRRLAVTPETHMTENQDVGRYEQCIVAFLDILGFKSKVLDSQDNAGTLENIIQSLKIVNAIPTGGKKVSTDSGGQRTILIRRRFFSDSLVFFLKEQPEDIAQLFFVIRYLQDQLWQRGICLRGSIVRGQMYWTARDDNVTVGQGLIDAHQREATIAIFPRIVVVEDLYRYIKDRGIPSPPFGTDHDTSLTDLIREDTDGIRFLDLLNCGVNRATGEHFDVNSGSGLFTIRYDLNAPSQHPEVLGSVDRIINGNIACEDEHIRQKYAWLRSYRNHSP